MNIILPRDVLSLLSLVLLTVFGSHPVALAVDLPFGEINVVVLTDVHSWVAGHTTHEPTLDANYGDILSFYERLKELAPDKDIFFVMNGDFMDGTGLSTYPPSHLTPILRFMPWDALTIGNHEFYKDENVEFITQDGGFVSHWNGKYLTSNVAMADSKEPIGDRYTYLHGKNTDSTILTFGFLYNFMEHCPITIVEPVEDAVQSKWFTQVLNEGSFDAILVLAHMDVNDPLVYVILDAIRSIVGPDMPVQFITGHTHYRASSELDENAVSFEAGRYLDTVGFVSFPTKTAVAENATDPFQHVFLDANVETLKSTLGVETMTTSSGSALSSLIHQTQKSLGLHNVIGCSSQRYYFENGLREKQSLWALYLREVVLRSFFKYNQSSILIQSTDSLRYDLFSGNVTLDDLIVVSPFNDTIYKVSERTLGADILTVAEILNQDDNSSASKLPKFVVSETIDPKEYYDLFTESISIPVITAALANVTGTYAFQPIQQFVDNVAVTTTGMWVTYVSQYWSCEHPGVKGANRWLLVSLSVIVAAAFFGWRYWSKRYIRQGYDNSVAQGEEDYDGVL